jgi:deazaflavin-dependent oxidoreductase (nitroreductase family)
MAEQSLYMRFGNLFMRTVLRSSRLHSIASATTMLLQVTGRKTGKQYIVPVNYVADPEDENILLVTSVRERTWWRNLRGGAPVTVWLLGEQMDVEAEAIEDEEDVVEVLGVFLEARPQFAQYMNIDVDDDGKPLPDSLADAAGRRVIVEVYLDG